MCALSISVFLLFWHRVYLFVPHKNSWQFPRTERLYFYKFSFTVTAIGRYIRYSAHQRPHLFNAWSLAPVQPFLFVRKMYCKMHFSEIGSAHCENRIGIRAMRFLVFFLFTSVDFILEADTLYYFYHNCLHISVTHTSIFIVIIAELSLFSFLKWNQVDIMSVNSVQLSYVWARFGLKRIWQKQNANYHFVAEFWQALISSQLSYKWITTIINDNGCMTFAQIIQCSNKFR